MTFILHERLEQDSIAVTDLKLSQVRLMNDSRFPWILLIPRKKNMRDIHDLSTGDRFLLMEEVHQISLVFKKLYLPYKINIGALGNIVPQLHVHIIARQETDEAWPGPVWGVGTARPYSDKDLKKQCKDIKASLA